jgi:hypothetical protein
MNHSCLRSLAVPAWISTGILFAIGAVLAACSSPNAVPLRDSGTLGGEGGRVKEDAGKEDGKGSVKTDGASLDATGRTTVKLVGAVNKGPFVQGSAVDVYPVDSTGNPSGSDYPTITSDALGDFSVTFAYQGPVLLKGEGYYYNEATGRLSMAPLTLNALASVSTNGTQNAYINLVTHLAETRETRLLGDGMTFEAAVTQAEGELRAALAIGGANFDPGAPGNQLNLFGGDDVKSAYLFAVSAVLAYDANIDGSTDEGDAALQALINTTQAAFETSGTLPSATTQLIAQAQTCVEPRAVTQDLVAYIGTLNLAVPPTIPDINLALDSDLDGVPNVSDSCPLVPNAPTTDGGAQPAVNGICEYARQDIALASSAGTSELLQGDVDGAHGLDLLVVESMPLSVTVMLNDGTGSFGAPIDNSLSVAGVPTTPGDSVSTLAFGGLADMDGDTHVDVVLEMGSAVVYLPGDGAGHFGNPTTLFTAPGAGLPFTVIDLNGDGRPDLVFFVGSISGTGIAPILAPASGSWPTPTTSAILPDGPGLPSNPQSTAYWVGNWSSSTTPDILVTTEQAGLLVLKGNGDGTFQGATSITTAGMNLQAITGGDLDGDGHVDLMVAQGAAPSGLVVAFGDGTGNVAGSTTIDLTAPPAFGCPETPGTLVSNLFVADLTGDGKNDLYVYPGGQVYVGGSRALLTASPILYPPASTPVLGDVNGDGSADVSGLGDTGIQMQLINTAGYHGW